MKTLEELDKIRNDKYFDYVQAEQEYQNMRKSLDPNYKIHQCGINEDENEDD